MTEEMVLTMGMDLIKICLMISGPMLLGAIGIGIVVSILQAATQINEATLTFIPKMIVILLVLMLMAPWMLKVLQDYSTQIFSGSQEWSN